jgi:hypothetical protein
MSKQDQKPEPKSPAKPERKQASDALRDKDLDAVSGGMKHTDEAPKE